MIRNALKRSLRSIGYEVRRVKRYSRPEGAVPPPRSEDLPKIEPVWPLPRIAGGPGDEAIRREFLEFDLWHYAYAFEGGLSFEARHNHPGPLTNDPKRVLQRFRHFMPYLFHAAGGSLVGKRVLDIACNSGFWSFQCALLGAEVVGFDARPELIEQANLIRKIIGLDNVQFKVLDFWEMSPEMLGGTFDVVLNLGILYHLPDPLRALQITRDMARDVILLDTTISTSGEPIISLAWEEPLDTRDAATAGVVAHASKSGIELMLRHLGVPYYAVPVRSADMPRDYLQQGRASWVIRA